MGALKGLCLTGRNALFLYGRRSLFAVQALLYWNV